MRGEPRRIPAHLRGPRSRRVLRLRVRLITSVAAVAVLAACGARPAGPPASAPRDAADPGAPDASSLVVPDDLPAVGLAGWLFRRIGDPRPGQECFLAWGTIARGDPLRLAWTGGSLEGRLLCDDLAEASMREPPIRQAVMVGDRDGELFTMHPSDIGDWSVLEPPDASMRTEIEAQPTVALLVLDDPSPGSAAVLLTRYQRVGAPWFFRTLMPLGD